MPLPVAQAGTHGTDDGAHKAACRSGGCCLYDEKSDGYLVTEPPMGTQVPYLPDGYTEETVNGVEYYKLGTIYYRPDLAGDDELFVVSKI